jgi:exopolysaccharide biosynthesis protein
MGKQTSVSKNWLIYLIILIPLISSADNQNDLQYQDLTINQHIVRTVTINPAKYKIINATAQSIQENTTSVDNLAKANNALAGINGGFFRKIDNNFSVPAGILKVNNIWHGIAYRNRAAIGWDPISNQVLIDRITTKSFVNLGTTKLPINYFNPNNPDNNQINQKIIVYSNIYPNFKNFDLNLNLTKNRQNFLITINNTNNSDNTPAYIFNVNNNHPDILELQLSAIKSAALEVTVYPELNPQTKQIWNNMPFITSGAPVLIKDNQKLSDYEAEEVSTDFINNDYPRTAIGILNNGFWLLAVTQSISIPELADIMAKLNCKDAINLDGGGSSDLYISKELSANAELLSLVNHVTDAVLVLPN